jgi:hypothetical protein
MIVLAFGVNGMARYLSSIGGMKVVLPGCSHFTKVQWPLNSTIHLQISPFSGSQPSLVVFISPLIK